MLKLFEFNCKSCGSVFEDYIDTAHQQHTGIECPQCKKLADPVRIYNPVHAKRADWSVH